MKIIQLTLNTGVKIYVNFSLVTDFYNTEDYTTLCFGTEDYYFYVEESAEYIYNSLKVCSELNKNTN